MWIQEEQDAETLKPGKTKQRIKFHGLGLASMSPEREQNYFYWFSILHLIFHAPKGSPTSRVSFSEGGGRGRLWEEVKGKRKLLCADGSLPMQQLIEQLAMLWVSWQLSSLAMNSGFDRVTHFSCFKGSWDTNGSLSDRVAEEIGFPGLISWNQDLHFLQLIYKALPKLLLQIMLYVGVTSKFMCLYYSYRNV